MAMIAIDNGVWSDSFIWLFVCFIIDGLDGSLARKARVTEVLPHMHGKNIDYVIDFTTYALIPAFFFYKAGMAHSSFMLPTLAVMLLSSALYYGKNNMVEDEQYFIGFPVLWNFVVFFQFFVFNNNITLNVISVLIIGVLHFIPLRYAYPSRARKYFIPHLIVSIIALSSALIVLLNYPNSHTIAQLLTILCGGYFIAFAIFETITAR